MTELKTTEAQRRALKAYRERNKSRARLPGAFLDDDIAKKLEELAEVKGSKMGAISEAIELLYEKEFS